MTKPIVILDPDWRHMDELFSAAAQAELFRTYDVIWGKNGPIPEEDLTNALPSAEILISATPRVSKDVLDHAPKLHTIIEVSGAFPDTIDYSACLARQVQVLTCAPGFRQSVAEMGLAMALGLARGLVPEHEAFRRGDENWLSDMASRDFTLFGARIGFVGYGQIAQELTRLLAPFSPSISAFDPWLPKSVAADFDIQLCNLDDLLRSTKCLFVTAVPTAENAGMIGARELALLGDRSIVVLLSRAHLVDFDALTSELTSRRISAAIDVFPEEPLPIDDPIRSLPNVLLSPHRAAAVSGGRQLIGDMILQDLALRTSGQPARNLGIADISRVASLAGVGDADSVSAMGQDRAD